MNELLDNVDSVLIEENCAFKLMCFRELDKVLELENDEAKELDFVELITFPVSIENFSTELDIT
jgi:hypothetical protein